MVGGITGAIEGYRETGTLEGTLRGMGRGAAKGAEQGAADGLISGMVSGAFAGAMNPRFCFVAGTTVLTTLGKKAIETIQVGDTIPCVDHITGEASEKKVISTTVNKVNRLIELDIDGETIQCTETHPFQVKGKGWVDACNLNPGDAVYTKDWNTATVNSVCLLELDEPVEVFNFEVEDFHTYFVGVCCVLVHNGCGDSYKSLTKSNYRNNSLKYHGSNGKNVSVHHRLPQQYRSQFEARGINIDSPVYTKLLDPTKHAKVHSSGYNKSWGIFFQNNPNATYVDIMKFAGIM